jgi:response regulator RpfG family c-di-GMP phosphodiesterase
MNSKTKVLYVDDEFINLQLFEINFSNKFEILTAHSGNEALILLDKNPDTRVVLSDMKMPNMNGIEFILKAKEKHSEKDYFILSGFDLNEEIHQALESNLILNYFRKPFNLIEIETAIINSVS